MSKYQEERFGFYYDNYIAGNHFLSKGDFNNAIKYYQETLKLKPDFLEAYNNLGNALREKGELNAALKYYQIALKLKPDFAQAHFNAGITFNQKGDLNAAIKCFQKASTLKPDHIEAHNNLGVTFKLKGDIEAAIQCFQKALALKPDFAQAHYNLGVTFKTTGDFNSAINSYEKAIKYNPYNHNAHNNLGNILHEKGNPNAAILYFQKALKLKPDFGLAYYNIGNILREKGDINGSIKYYQEALKLNPNIEQAHYNLGISYKTKGDLIPAINAYKNAIKLNPESIAAHFNLGQAIFLIGNDYKKAWLNYEYRFKKPDEPVIPHAKPSIPKWQGESLNLNEKLLVVTEQGLGDTIQFMRYIPYLRNQGIKVSFCAQTKLHELIKASKITSKPLTPEKGNEVIEGKWVSLLSLPHFLNVTPKNTLITNPYIHSSKGQISKWKKILSTEKKPIIGINWQGNPNTELINLRGRSFPLEIFSSIAEDNYFKFLSLQKGFGSEQLETCSFKDQFVQCQDQVNKTWGFLETAAMISNCDLVITSDTYIAHLAAGLGKLTWCLLHSVPDWRWGIKGKTTFWYPSMKLFRQERCNNWVEVIEKVAIELKLLFPSK